MIRTFQSEQWQAKYRAKLQTLILCSLLLNGCNSTPEQPHTIVPGSYNTTTQNIYHIGIPSNNQKQKLIFIHGSPGSWKDWKQFLNDEALQKNFELQSIDRPGFGETRNQALPNIQKQAAQLNQFINDKPKDTILVGWSYGGPIALEMSLNNPNIKGIILVAASLSPELEYPRWYNKILDFKPIHWLSPAFVSHSNDEMMNLATDLSKLESKLKQINIPVYLLQGELDGLVFPETAEYAKKHIDEKYLTVEMLKDQGHAIVWDKPQSVIRAIMKVKRKIDKKQKNN